MHDKVKKVTELDKIKTAELYQFVEDSIHLMNKKVIKVKNALSDILLYSDKTFSQEKLNQKETKLNKL